MTGRKGSKRKAIWNVNCMSDGVIGVGTNSLYDVGYWLVHWTVAAVPERERHRRLMSHTHTCG
jgi:hypothetical protein